MSAVVQISLTDAIDALDVAVIAPRAPTFCTMTLSTGQQVPGDFTPEDAGAALDAAAGITSGSLFAGPFTATGWPAPLYVAGAAVRSLRATPNGLGCSLVFGASPGMVTVPNVTLADMVTALNACAVPAPEAPENNYGNRSLWTPTIFDTQGTTTPNLNTQAIFTRTGPWGAATSPQAGDAMQLQMQLFSVIPIGERPIFEVSVPNVPANAPIANGYFTCTWNLTNITGDVLDSTRFRWNRVAGGDRFSCQYEGAVMVAETTIRIDCVVTYIVDAA